MAKRSAARREEWRQERIDALGTALGRLLQARGAGNQVNLVTICQVAVDSLDAYDRQRRQRLEAITDEIRELEKSEKTTSEPSERGPIVFDFDAIRNPRR